MMHIILVTIAVSIPFFGICQEKDQHEIDIWLTNCLTDSMSTSGMRHCTIEAERKWEEELNKYYDSLIGELHAEKQIILKESQNAWLIYREKQREFNSTYFYEIKEGTMWYPVSDNENLQITKERAIQLRNFQNMLEY